MIQMSNTKRILIVLATASLVSLTACKVKLDNTQGTTDANPAAAPVAGSAVPVNPNATLDPDKSLALQIDVLPVRGNANAKVTIIEFSDYQCPFCSRVEPTIAQLLKDYPNDVRVAFINMPLAFHKEAMPAAKAAIAAQKQGKFWEMHDALFANQKALSDDFLKAQAEKLGLDMARFEADRNNPETEKLINKGMKDAQGYGLSGTPSFLINGVTLVGAQPVDAFKKVIDAELARANKVAAEKKIDGNALYEELVKTAPKPAPEPDEDTPAGRVLVDLAGAPVRGNVDAPVTIVEFTDFECPFCSRANNTLEELINKPENKDNVRLVFKHFPLSFHKNAKLAHQAAQAAKLQGDDKFWAMYDKIFANQKAMSRDDLIKYAGEVGLDVAKFTADLDSDAVIKAVEADVKAGNAAGVRGTPHFFFNGTLLSGAQPLPAFQAALDREVAAAKDPKYAALKGNALYEQIIKDNQPAPEPPIVVDIAGAPFRGAADAPVTIIQFSEFQCPFCSRVEPTLNELLNKEAYKGKIKVVFKQFPLPFHNNAQKAAEAALFAHENGKFWELHEKMFANQQNLDVESLKKYATEVGLDAAALDAALSSDKYAAAVTADKAAGEKAGISGTPSFVINGKLVVGALPVAQFEAVIDEALKAAAAPAPAPAPAPAAN